MLLHEYLDIDTLWNHVDRGLVNVRCHPTEHLSIFNYTTTCQVGNHWDAVTSKCRGLIIDEATTEVMARPFPKFFNAGQEGAPDWTRWDPAEIQVVDKVDGSLGIIYQRPRLGGVPAVATRGSFTSDQALWATRFLTNRYPDFWPHEGVTYLVEIIYPGNRIVVDYKGQEELFLLDILNNETGKSLLSERLLWPEYERPFPVATHYTLEDVSQHRDNAEGFVLLNTSTMERVKIKYPEYLRLHKLMTGVTEKTLWELLANGEDTSRILETVPDEFFDWARGTIDRLTGEYNRKYRALFKAFLHALTPDVLALEEGRERRKLFAKEVVDSPYRGIYFMLYDDKDPSAAIWDLVKPESTTTFWNRELAS